jgi:hypothetical protein
MAWKSILILFQMNVCQKNNNELPRIPQNFAEIQHIEIAC